MAGVNAPGGQPDGPGRWSTLALLVPGLVLFSLFLVPSEAALTNGPALLVDNLLRALAVVALTLAVLVAVAETSVAARAAVVASALCVLIGAAVLFAGLWSPFRDWWALTGAALASAAGVLDLYRLRRVWSGIQGTTTKLVAGILTVAAVPAFNFWSDTSFLPSRNAASLEMSAGAVVHQDLGGSTHWVITSTIRNRSSVRAFVIVSGLTVCRWADEAHWQRDTAAGDAPAEQCEPLLAPFSEGSWLDPDVPLTVSTPTRHDPARPLLQVRLRVAYARADRVIEVLDSRRDATAAERGACVSARISDLQPQSRLTALARRELALMYADVEGDGGSTYFFGAADHLRCVRIPEDPQRNATRFQRLNRYFGLTEATTVWVGWPDGGPAAGDGAPAG